MSAGECEWSGFDGELKAIVAQAVDWDTTQMTAKELGFGDYGTVYKVTSAHNQHVALKVIPMLEQLIENKKKYLREMSVMKRLNNYDIVVKYIKSWSTPHFTYILMELCECDLNVLIKSMTDIFKIKDNVEPNQFEYFVSFTIFNDIAQGVHYIHSQDPPIMHRDLKPTNILMTSDGKLKLADFDLAKVLSDTITKSGRSITHTAGVGSEKFIAPEVSHSSNNHHYNELCDMFSLGMIGEVIFIFNLLSESNPEESPRITSFRDIISKLITVKFKTRPNSERLLEMLSEIEPVDNETVLAEYLNYTDELRNDKHKNLYTYISTKIDLLQNI